MPLLCISISRSSDIVIFAGWKWSSEKDPKRGKESQRQIFMLIKLIGYS